MELRVLEYFLAVAREQSISGAAEYLHLTQPTLSRQLREMLPEDRWDTLAKYQDAAAELHSMELEAMFQAALSLAGELR